MGGKRRRCCWWWKGGGGGRGQEQEEEEHGSEDKGFRKWIVHVDRRIVFHVEGRKGWRKKVGRKG